MIPSIEILEKSREWGLRPNVVEKDYALGWILAAMAAHPVTKKWVFKGGTCLRKCYFETYRFSEDLDFTFQSEEVFDGSIFLRAFQEIAPWVYDQCGLELPKEGMTFEVYRNSRGRVSMEGRLSYRGPVAPRGTLPRIKLDLTQDELLVCAPVLRRISHTYSDKPSFDPQVLAYSYVEIFGEKFLALVERQLPRDLYDVVNMFRYSSMRPPPKEVWELLQKKCAYKGVSFPTLEELKQHPRHQELASEWANMLSHQLPDLPSMDVYWNELRDVFDWVTGDRHDPHSSRGN